METAPGHGHSAPLGWAHLSSGVVHDGHGHLGLWEQAGSECPVTPSQHRPQLHRALSEVLNWITLQNHPGWLPRKGDSGTEHCGGSKGYHRAPVLHPEAPLDPLSSSCLCSWSVQGGITLDCGAVGDPGNTPTQYCPILYP